MKTMGVGVDEETYQRIERFCEDHKYIKTKSQFLKIAIQQLLEKEEGKKW